MEKVRGMEEESEKIWNWYGDDIGGGVKGLTRVGLQHDS